jgi:phage-related protein
MDIFTVNAWATATFYKKNSIVTNAGYYYYSMEGHTSGGTFAGDLAAGKWNGVINFENKLMPYFFWQPSYNYNVDITPTVKVIKFGDNYIQDVTDGINNILLPFNLPFSDRDLDQTTAILHFLHARNGVERFVFIPPSPYGISKKFVCQKWNYKQAFYDKYNIEAMFEERIV